MWAVILYHKAIRETYPREALTFKIDLNRFTLSCDQLEGALGSRTPFILSKATLCGSPLVPTVRTLRKAEGRYCLLTRPNETEEAQGKGRWHTARQGRDGCPE